MVGRCCASGRGNTLARRARRGDAQRGVLLVALPQKQGGDGFFNRARFRPLFSPDSQHLLVADERSTHFILVEAHTGKTIATLRQERDGWGMSVLAAAFSPDGK